MNVGLSTVLGIALLWSGLAISGERETDRRTQYLRCAAISYVLATSHPDATKREMFRNAPDLHAKWASRFYKDNPEEFRTDAMEAQMAVDAEMQDKQFLEERLKPEVAVCMSLMRHTLDFFIDCALHHKLTDEDWQRCADMAVGLESGAP